jgi:hypothetical protein
MKRRQRQSGGGWGFTGPSSIPGTPGTVNNAQVFTGIGDCRAVKPGYDIPYSNYAASFKGLPGMSGGKRTRKGSKGKKTRKQRGGRYGFFPESIGTVTPNGAAWWAGSYAPIQRIGCEGGSFNPLNPTHTGSSAPPGAANPNYWLKGGGSQMAPATYGVGNVDSMYYYGPTAGYANTASTWKDSVGAPVQIQVPFAARAMNQACLTTGGHPPLTGALQKGGKSRKQRGGLGVGNVTGLFGKAANTLRRLVPFGQAAPKPLANAGVNAVAAKVNANIAAVNANAAVAAAANAEANAAAAAANALAKNPPGVVMGGKRKKRHAKKRTHKRRH